MYSSGWFCSVFQDVVENKEAGSKPKNLGVIPLT